MRMASFSSPSILRAVPSNSDRTRRMVTVFVNGQPKYIMHADTFAKLYFEAEDKAQRPIHEGHLYQLPPQRHGTDEDK